MTIKAQQISLARDGVLTQAGCVGSVAMGDGSATPAFWTAAVAMQGGSPFERRQEALRGDQAGVVVGLGVRAEETQHDGGQDFSAGDCVLPHRGRLCVIAIQVTGEEFEPSWRVEPNCTHP